MARDARPNWAPADWPEPSAAEMAELSRLLSENGRAVSVTQALVRAREARAEHDSGRMGEGRPERS